MQGSIRDFNEMENTMQNDSSRQTTFGPLRFLLDLRLFLVLVGVVYAAVFWRYQAAPGHDPGYPLGWWGWFDQGEYLKSAKAFAAFDFSASQHFCPPLYSMLGAFFVGFTDPFWLIDLLCLLWFAAVFVLFADRYVPRWASLLIFTVTILASHRMLENFVIPWTTSLAMALLSTGVYALVRLHEALEGKAGQSFAPGVGYAFGIALVLGLLFPLRPLDILLSVILLGAWCAGAKNLLSRGNQAAVSVKVLAAACAGFLVGPLLYAAFNWMVFGTLNSDYVQDSISNGYFPGDLGEKFLSIFRDGRSLYLEPRSGIVDRYPWILLVFPSLIYIAVRGDSLLRVLALLVFAQYILYLPYGDLLPTGLWRFKNIHYFKWTFPYLGLFSWFAVASILRAWKTERGSAAAWTLVFAAGILLILSLRFQISQRPLEIGMPEGGQPLEGMVFRNPYAQLDMIDLEGLDGEFRDVYFGSHVLLVDGEKMRHVTNYRVLPAPWGVRILFIRPVTARLITFRPDSHLTQEKATVAATAGTYGFTLGLPKLFLD